MTRRVGFCTRFRLPRLSPPGQPVPRPGAEPSAALFVADGRSADMAALDLTFERARAYARAAAFAQLFVATTGAAPLTGLTWLQAQIWDDLTGALSVIDELASE